MHVNVSRSYIFLAPLLISMCLVCSCKRFVIKHQQTETSQPLAEDQIAPNEKLSQDSPVEVATSAPEDDLTLDDNQGVLLSMAPTGSQSIQIAGSLTLPKQDKPSFPSFLAPTLDGWPTEPLWPDKEVQEPPSSDYPLFAVAVYNHSPVYDFEPQKSKLVGRIRYGTTIRAKGAVEKPGCSSGQWYEIISGGYVCSAEGFRVGKKAYAVPARVSPPATSQVEPFLYGKVESGAPRYQRIPTLAEEQALAKLSEEQAKSLDYLDKFLHGIYFIGIVDEVEDQQRFFYRTSMGNYVRKEKVKVLQQSGMHGELLQSKEDLPIAFVFGEARQVFQLREGELHSLGVIEKHARFRVAGSYRYQDQEYVIGPQQIAVLREGVRVAALHARPDGIPENAKWLHLNLAQQTFVAYEGNTPVLASLFSSGIKGRDTPTGLYQINRKYLTKTMCGVDDKEGWYEVGEVPWTFYYRGNYAVHGAYWHNVFGETRSHGCTNIPPADARWLFGWFEPQLPKGWHAQFNKDHGWTYFTDTQVEIKPYQPNPAESEHVM